MRYGRFLSPGGTIGFVAPSFGSAMQPYRAAFENSLDRFHDMGYNTLLGPNCYEGCGVGISNKPELCGREFEEYYIKDGADVLISCGGGELMCEILDHIDFNAVKAAPAKWFMGYSDNTNLTYLLATICDVASVYGPCAASFGMEPWHESVKDAFGIITGAQSRVNGYPAWEKESLKTPDTPLVPYNTTEKTVLAFHPGGPDGMVVFGEDIPETEFSGRLIGGCMDCLVNLLGTRYDRTQDFLARYKDDGFVWFLEACDLNVFAIRRAMWQMEHAGWFENVKGFIIGRPLSGMDGMFNLDRYDAVLYAAASHGVPVVMDADLGHLPPSMPLVTGSYASVRIERGKLGIEMSMI